MANCFKVGAQWINDHDSPQSWEDKKNYRDFQVKQCDIAVDFSEEEDYDLEEFSLFRIITKWLICIINKQREFN